MVILETLLESGILVPIIVAIVTAFVTHYIDGEKNLKTYKETILLAKNIAKRYDIPAGEFLEELLTRLHDTNTDSKKEEEVLVDELSKEKKQEEGN